MFNQVNFKALAGMVAAFTTAYFMGTGEIQNFVQFADPLNEMAFCVLALMAGIGCIMNLKK